MTEVNDSSRAARSTESDDWERAGEILNERYRLDRIIGQGGMGLVAEGTHLLLNAPVAIKLPHARFLADERAMERFWLEARATVQIRNEHVVRVLDLGTDAAGAPYIVMERLHGQNLHDVIGERGPLAPADAVELMLQVIDGVSTAHGLGILHRDLKSKNIFLVSKPDGGYTAKVLDFGIAKVVAEANREAITQSGAVVGSPGYMAPEQLRGEDVDVAADIWALGVVLFEMVTGVLPFQGSTPSAVGACILVDPPRAPRSLCPDLPVRVERVLFKCLNKRPLDRYPSAEAMGRVLRGETDPGRVRTAESTAGTRLHSDDRHSDPDETLAPPAEPARAHGVRWVLGGSVLAAAGAAGMLWHGDESRLAPGRTSPAAERSPATLGAEPIGRPEGTALVPSASARPHRLSEHPVGSVLGPSSPSRVRRVAPVEPPVAAVSRTGVRPAPTGTRAGAGTEGNRADAPSSKPKQPRSLRSAPAAAGPSSSASVHSEPFASAEPRPSAVPSSMPNGEALDTDELRIERATSTRQ